MKINIKSILKILLILLFWFLGGLIFRYQAEYYNLLSIPKWALSPKLISLSWLIIYIFISISIYKISEKINIIKTNDYIYVLLTNYLANQLFPFVFFNLKSPFLGFIMTAIVYISSIFLFIETKKIDKKSSYFLIPYIIYNTYALLLSISVYIMNF